VRLRVVSYNVHGLGDDLAALTAAVRELEPDVLVVQEGPRRFRWRGRCGRLAQSLGMVYAGGGLPSLGNVVLTTLRVRAHEHWTVQFPLTPGRHLRGGVFVRCSVGRTPFVVAGSHLATDAAERPQQALILKKLLSEVDVPVILGVDLNETSGGGAWRTVADGLVDAAEATGQAGTATYPVVGASQRLDAILVDPAFEVTGYRVVDTPRTRLASDHFPVLADLVLPG